MDRFAVATAAAQMFEEQYRGHEDPVSEADARELVLRLRECLRDEVEFNPANTSDAAIRRATDPKRKDRVLYRKRLNARVEQYILEGRPLPWELRQWVKVRDDRPKYLREPPNRVRDAWIVRTLMVLQDCGISPTRNRDKHEQGPPLSGCAIVVAVLDDMNNEATVEKVWEYREHVL